MEQSRHGQGVTSVKVHHRPGGASSICLGGGYGGEGSVLDGKKPAATPATGTQEEEKQEQTQQAAAAVPNTEEGIRRIAPGV